VLGIGTAVLTLPYLVALLLGARRRVKWDSRAV
jgi:hypothetical protein